MNKILYVWRLDADVPLLWTGANGKFPSNASLRNVWRGTALPAVAVKTVGNLQVANNGPQAASMTFTWQHSHTAPHDRRNGMNIATLAALQRRQGHAGNGDILLLLYGAAT
jgi:hypothetical protein